MAETFPTDTELEAKSGVTDTDTGFVNVTKNKDDHYTAWFKQAWQLLYRSISALQVYKDSTAVLKFAVRAGNFFNGDTLVAYAGATNQSLTNNATNYLYLTAAGALTVNTTGFPIPSVTPHIRLATIATGSASASGTSGDFHPDPAQGDIIDRRDTALFGISGAGSGDINSLDWQESVQDELDFTAAEPGAPSDGDRYLNTGSGASSGTGQTVAANDIEVWNGTNWTEITPTEGACTLVEDRDMIIGFNGSAWVDLGTFANIKDLTDGGNADALHVHDTAGITAGAVTNTEVNASAAIARSKLASNTDTITIDPYTLKKHNALNAIIPSAPDSTYLGILGAPGSLLVGTNTNNTQENEQAAFVFVLPPEYVAQQNITVRIKARVDVARNAESLLDVVVKRLDENGLDATDLCLTSPIDMKAVTSFANEDFTIDGDAGGDELAPGTVLIISIAFETDDTGGGSAGRGEIGLTQVLVPKR